jgi:hypothetical protein
MADKTTMVTKLKAAIQFGPVSWRRPITEVVSLLSDEPVNDVDPPS